MCSVLYFGAASSSARGGIDALAALAKECLREQSQRLRIAFQNRRRAASSACSVRSPRVAEGRVAQVMREAGAFRQVGVDEHAVIQQVALLQVSAQTAADLERPRCCGFSRVR